jgi:hypothetical protein
MGVKEGGIEKRIGCKSKKRKHLKQRKESI